MSGFELAGIILAVIPLVLEGLKAYPKSGVYKTSKAFIHAKKERREFAAQLLLMHTELRFAVIEVFKQINLSLTVDERRELTAADSVGSRFFDLWKRVAAANPDVIEKEFEHTIDHIKDVLEDMVEVLNEMMKHTAISYDAGRQSLKAILKDHNDDTMFSIKRNLSERFKFAYSDSTRHKLLERMREDIKLLKKLNKGQAQLKDFIAAGHSIELQKSHIPFLDRVRNGSDNIYHALSNIFHCGSHESHSAMLKLETRDAPERKNSDLRFSLILTFESSSLGNQDGWVFQESEIRIDQKFNSLIDGLSNLQEQ